MKKILLYTSLMLLVAWTCRATDVNPTSFQKLCNIYTTATQTLNEVHSSNDLEKTFQTLEKLQKECQNTPSLQSVLKLTYSTCPSTLKTEYEQALKLQRDMKDAVKRLAMAGELKSAKAGNIVDEFIKTVHLQELVSDERSQNEGAPFETQKQRDARMKWWRDGKFGMFIHYGLYSGLGGEFQGKTYEGCVEWIQMMSGADAETYKKEAMPRFTPKTGMAEKWVKLAKEAGCTYTVLSSRHHEGYNMFDTQYSDFNVMKTKGVDIIKEYAAACKKEDIKAGYYFSLLDWSHPNYDPTNSGISYPEGNYEAVKRGERHFGNHAKYKEYLSNIFNDLINQYKVDLIWWDFSQPKFQGDYAWGATQLMKDLFHKNPKAIQNNRLYHSDNHISEGGIKVTPTWKGDYSTAEHHIPSTGIDGDWEACQTLNGTWGYSSGNQKWKTADVLIHELIDVVSRGGNFLLNIGPKPDGSIPEESIQLFRTIGNWMKINGDAIYGTRANPFAKEFAWGRVTRKGDNKLYLLLYTQPKDGKIELPCSFKNGKVKARLLHNRATINVSQQTNQCILDVSQISMQPLATVIEVDGKWIL
ncbi:MAG: alpha-L-fucosidase [Bacteroidales bacterium]